MRKKITPKRLEILVCVMLLSAFFATLHSPQAFAAKYTKAKVQSLLTKTKKNLKKLKAQKKELVSKNKKATKNILYFWEGRYVYDSDDIVIYKGQYYSIENWYDFDMFGEFVYGYVKKTRDVKHEFSPQDGKVHECICAVVVDPPETTSLDGVNARIDAANAAIANCNNALKNKVTKINMYRSLTNPPVNGFIKGRKYYVLPALKYKEPYSSCSIKSSNSRILSFQSNGKAKINGFGKVTLSGKLSISGKSFKKTIKIVKGIEKIKLNKKSFVLYCDESVALPGYTITPSGGKGSLKWEVMDESEELNDAVYISGNKIVANLPGTAVISLVDKDNGASARVNITVKDKPASLSMQQPDSNYVTLNQTVKLKLSVTGEYSTKITEDLASFLSVSLSDPSAATAKIEDQYLLITFKKYGPVTVNVSIKGKTRAAATASTTFHVSANIGYIDIDIPVRSLYSSPDSNTDTIYLGETYEYPLTVRNKSYQDVYSGLDKLLIIVTDDPSLASITISDNKLIVTPKKAGVLKLKVHAADSESMNDQITIYIY